MAFVITQPCEGVKDASCVEVCPVDCIHSDDDAPMYYINPDDCIDCAYCVAVCPVSAIFDEFTVPANHAGVRSHQPPVLRALIAQVVERPPPAQRRTYRTPTLSRQGRGEFFDRHRFSSVPGVSHGPIPYQRAGQRVR